MTGPGERIRAGSEQCSVAFAEIQLSECVTSQIDFSCESRYYLPSFPGDILGIIEFFSGPAVLASSGTPQQECHQRHLTLWFRR